MASRRKHIPWKRFWCPLGAQINTEFSGPFLANPESEFGRDWSPNTFLLEELLDRRWLVLCGDPGMGKTDAVEHLIPLLNKHDLLHIEFRNIPDTRAFDIKTFDSNQWKEWLESDRELTLLIDGVDEGLFVVRSFIEYLTDKLRSLPLEAIGRLRLILVCRTLEWPHSPGEVLLDLWRSSQQTREKHEGNVFELCPLRRVDVALAAETSGIDTDKFFEAVWQKHLQSLAARPVTLFMLLDEFVEEGTISKSHRELYDSACRNLCKEPDKARLERFRHSVGLRDEYSPSRLYEVASRIAAMLMLSGKFSIFRGNASDATQSDLLMETITSGTEKDEAGAFLITESLVTATLATNLFDAKGVERFGFQHLTFAECLAGAYLRRMSLSQFRSLLCKRDTAGEYVVPQLSEVAAWVAVDREDFFDYLVKIEPEILLRSDVTNLREEQKARLTTALLEKSRRAEHFQNSDRRAFYSALFYPKLADLLRCYILDVNLNVVVRRLAIDIAVACKLKNLLDDFLSILRRSNDPVQRQAGYALDDLVDEKTASTLIPIVDGTFEPCPPMAVRRNALLGLLKTIWSVTDSLPYLHDFALSDRFLDWAVAPRIKRNDIAPLLREMCKWKAVFSTQSCLHKVVDRTCALALEEIQDDNIAELLTSVIEQSLQDYSFPSHGDKGVFIEKISADSNIRYKLIRKLLIRDSLKNEILSHAANRLCLPEDFDWLLEELINVPQSARGQWSKVIHYLSTNVRIMSTWDIFLNRFEQIAELKREFGWLHTYEIDGPDGKAAREHWEKHLRMQEEHQLSLDRHRTPPRKHLIERALLNIANGKPEWWIAIVDSAFITSDRQRGYVGTYYDITTSPEWLEATEERREQIREAARLFLLTRDKEIPRGPNRPTNHSDAAFVACWLLRDEIAVPGSLQVAVAAYCIPSIVWYGLNDTEDQVKLTSLVYSLNPERCRTAFQEHLEADAITETGITLATRPFLSCWDVSLSLIAVSFLTSTMRKPETIRSLLGELAQLDPDAAKDVWRKTALFHIANGDASTQSVGATTEIIVNDFLAEMWHEVLPFLKKNPAVTQYAILNAAYHRHRSEKPRVSLNESQLADFYLLLRHLFPPEEDPGWPENGERTVSPRMEVGQYRDGVLQMLTNLANEEACLQIQRIAAEVSGSSQIWILRKYREAVELTRRHTWNPLDTKTFLEVVRRRDACLVENEDDLMLVVLDSLERLQCSLNAAPEGDVLRFWRFDRDHNRLANFRPHAEVDVTREIYSHLKRDIGNQSGVIVLREVTIRWDQKRTDIDVVVISNSGGNKREIILTIEVKGCWNPDIRKAVESQLVEKYLRPAGRTHGIYLVAYFVCSKWEQKGRRTCALLSNTIENSRLEVAELCRPFSGAATLEQVVPFVLDCRL